MEIALLIQSAKIFVEEIEKYTFIGKLSLNGDLILCVGVLSIAIEDKDEGINNAIVPIYNLLKVSLISDIDIFKFNKLNEATDFLTEIKHNSLLKDIKDNIK